ncbi:Inner membrane protein YjjP [compost metagenome]
MEGAALGVEICLLAGKIMLQSGGETYRVEDTMIRMSNALGLHGSHSYVTPTGIIFQAGETMPAKLIRIEERTTNLHKVSAVNDISRQLSSGAVAPSEAHDLLIQIDSSRHAYPLVLQIIAAAVASGCFTLMFKGSLADFIPGVLCGGLGYIAYILLNNLIKIKFFAEFTASFLIGSMAFLLVKIGLGVTMDKIIVGSVMPLVPGLLITNAVRDLMAGHLVSGLSRGAEAFLTAFAIGAGIAVAFSIL